MKSDNTFLEEFNWLRANNPQALNESKTKSINETIQDHFQDTSFNTERENLIRLPDSFFDTDRFDSEMEVKVPLMDEEAKGVNNLYFNEVASNHIFEEKELAALTADFGNDAFGFYLPMHSFFKSKGSPWGIYLFLDIIFAQAKKLHKTFAKLNLMNMYLLYSQCVYRHELFHYQTERFATSLEVLNRKAYYLKYQEEIYSKYALTEDWLEECLAESAVLKSRMITNKVGIDSKLRNQIYEFDLKNMPPGYRDYECKKYNGSKNAHKYLSSQIIHLENAQPLPTSILNIKTSFAVNDKTVPLYAVLGLNKRRIH
jgi:hypothetical protein